MLVSSSSVLGVGAWPGAGRGERGVHPVWEIGCAPASQSCPIQPWGGPCCCHLTTGRRPRLPCATTHTAGCCPCPFPQQPKPQRRRKNRKVVEPQVKVQSAAVDMVTGKTPASPVGEVETLVVQVLGIFFFVLLTEGLVLAGSVSVVCCCCCCLPVGLSGGLLSALGGVGRQRELRLTRCVGCCAAVLLCCRASCPLSGTPSSGMCCTPASPPRCCSSWACPPRMASGRPASEFSCCGSGVACSCMACLHSILTDTH